MHTNSSKSSQSNISNTAKAYYKIIEATVVCKQGKEKAICGGRAVEIRCIWSRKIYVHHPLIPSFSFHMKQQIFYFNAIGYMKEIMLPH